MSTVCGIGIVAKSDLEKKTNIACIDKISSGAQLVEAMKTLNVNIDMAISNDWLNNKSSGYPQLAQAIAKLSVVDGFAEFKTPDFGTVPIENIAETFAKSLGIIDEKTGQGAIWKVTADDYKGNYAKLRNAILFRWKEKHSQHLVSRIKGFNDIVNKTKTGSADSVNMKDFE